ncbi:MAG TPA: cupin domain-containing protein [Candidatus Limnocylindria bacterium]|jgi:anti-sigma factor ChrR (cupin superfamily)|nr:cupin domain-containing protein [Candidatus Limnocylindria bacterium]
MKCFELQELAALKATGALDAAGSARLDAMLAVDPDVAEEVAAMSDAVSAMVRAVVIPRTPPSSLRAAILARLRATPQEHKRPVTSTASEPPSARPAPAFSFLEASEEGWFQTPFPGIRAKLLLINQQAGYRILLTEFAAGTHLPRHLHQRGDESLYLLSGDLHTQGRRLKAGDFMNAETGTDHAELWTVEGCRAIVVDPIEGAEFDLSHVHS